MHGTRLASSLCMHPKLPEEEKGKEQRGRDEGNSRADSVEILSEIRDAV